jgi:hypothetical protein
MASTFALACDALVRERDRVFLERIAAEYNLPVDELKAKYTETAAKVAVKKPRKAKVTVEGPNAPPKCQATTAKKGPCSFAALKGECFCKRHLKQQNEAKAPAVAKQPGAIPPPPSLEEPKTEPVHKHEPDEEMHDDCELCQSHGNPLEFEAEEYEEGMESGSDMESEFDEE